MSYFRKCLKVPGNAPRQKPGISVNYPEHVRLFDVFIQALDQFISDNPESWHDYRDDLLFVAYNAQRRNDTNLNYLNMAKFSIVRFRCPL